ncbi:hypothetical protein EVAR_97202_1 [Eumeta japonica]|uniref:Uncharacterized protein n=1 Tax=Eumeta variegata TaxID=151549 RepID=A0A4C1WH69_EUMVA|nr:hypothetical protein EVAR_97202_1 [Eumeta japonica]
MFSRNERSYERSESRRSPPSMDTRNPRGVTSALPILGTNRISDRRGAGRWRNLESKFDTGREIELKVESEIEIGNEVKIKIDCGIIIRIKSATGIGMKSSTEADDRGRGCAGAARGRFSSDRSPARTDGQPDEVTKLVFDLTRSRRRAHNQSRLDRPGARGIIDVAIFTNHL